MTVSRRSVLKISVGVATGSALAGLPGLSFAAGPTWDWSDEYGENGQTAMAARFFVAELEKRIGDELQIVYQPGKVLGFGSADHFDAVRDGAVPMAVSLSTLFSGIDPLFDVTSLPFLVKDLNQARTLWATSRGEFESIFDANDMVVLYAMPNAPSGIWAKKPIDTVAALQNLRIRTYDANGTRLFAAAGAAPLQIAFSDVVPQLSTGGIDAVLTSADGGTQFAAWDYLSHFTALNYAMALFMIHANKESYEQLPDHVKAAVVEVSALTEDYAWQIVLDSIENAYGLARSHDITIIETPPDESFAHLQAAGTDLKNAWVERVGERGAQVLAAFDAAKS